MDLFPAIFVSQVPLHIIHVVVFAISLIIFAQSPHENHGNETDQEDDHHERIEDREPVDSVLKERGVQILVESVFELDARLFPVDLIGEGNLFVELKLHFGFTGQVDVDNVVGIVADVQFLMGPQVVGVIGLIDFADDSPNRHIVDIHLIPVVVLHCIYEGLQFFFGQHHFAVRRGSDIGCTKIEWCQTFATFGSAVVQHLCTPF